MRTVKRMNTASDTIMATMWTFKALVDSEPEAACADERLNDVLEAMMKVTSEMNDAIQAVLKGGRE